MDYFFDKILLPLIVGGIGAYAYPRFEAYLKHRSLSSRQRKLFNLKHHYYFIKRMKRNNEYLNYQRFRAVERSIIWLGFLVASCAVLILGVVRTEKLTDTAQNVFYGISFVFVSFILFTLMTMTQGYRKDAYDVFYFDEFKEKTIGKLKKLGGNPEALD